ncbi:hypothetical protein BT93_H0607 [Corymbia citriodora subsp. variegata]|nr:hypothetical protein BT93_H0607 [Corymbia citriodora subsp. variegata]
MEPVQRHQDHNTNSKSQRRTRASVSIFSGMLLVLLSSFLVPLCFHSFKSLHFSAYFRELQFFSYTPNKNHMFLLCNGILMILAGISGLIESERSGGVVPSGPQATHDDPRFDGHVLAISNEPKETRETTDAEEKLPMAVKGEFLIQEDEIQERGSELAITVASHDHDEGDEFEDEYSRDQCLITEQATQEQPRDLMLIPVGAAIDYNDHGNDDEADGELSVEELNRKCDEFIKKMRGEL